MFNNYLNTLKSYGFVSHPIDFKYEIHALMYLLHCHHTHNIDINEINNSYRVLASYTDYGYIMNQNSDYTFHLAPVYNYGSILIHINSIKSTINLIQYDYINKLRQDLNNEIIKYKIIKDMNKSTSLIVSKKINKNFYWT